VSAITRVREPYSDAERQAEAAMMGIYVFVGTEIMLFGGLFLTIGWLRFEHPHEFVAASREMHWWLAGGNTAVLLTSSAAVALAVEKAREGARQATSLNLAIALLLGACFLCLKALEYSWEFADGLLPVQGSGFNLKTPAHQLFIDLYLVATGLHAVHLTVGLLLLAGLLLGLIRQRLGLPARAVLLMTIGVYWHFVDVVWIFLYPLLYLAR